MVTKHFRDCSEVSSKKPIVNPTWQSNMCPLKYEKRRTISINGFIAFATDQKLLVFDNQCETIVFLLFHLILEHIRVSYSAKKTSKFISSENN